MSNDKTEERAAFEAWFKRAYSEDSLKPMESGCYLQRGAGMAWDAWQARAALSSRPVPQWFDEPFVAEGLQSMGLQSPTPREFGETIARRYAARIKELEAALSSAPAQPVREPMTDEQILAALASCTNEPPRRLPPGFAAFARAIERHHGICKE